MSNIRIIVVCSCTAYQRYRQHTAVQPCPGWEGCTPPGRGEHAFDIAAGWAPVTPPYHRSVGSHTAAYTAGYVAPDMGRHVSLSPTPPRTTTQWSSPTASTPPRLSVPNFYVPHSHYRSLTYAMCVWAEYSSSGSPDSPVDCHISSVDTSGGAVSDSDTRVWRDRLKVAKGGSS